MLCGVVCLLSHSRHLDPERLQPYRAFAQLVTSELLERYPDDCGVAGNRVLAHMQQFLATNKDLQAARQTIGPCISRFDPQLACQPQGIFCKVRVSTETLHRGICPDLLQCYCACAVSSSVRWSFRILSHPLSLPAGEM